MSSRKTRPAFWDRLSKEIEGDVTADLFARGRYATDASIHQCFPAGVVCPKTSGDVAIVIEMAREEGLPLTARGGGTSTAGQSLGEGAVIDFSKYLKSFVDLDAEAMRCTVEPGCTPAALNALLERHGLVLPVDIASAQQATLGGMVGNNSSGLRSLRYGNMRDTILSAEAFLSDGQKLRFAEISQSEGTGRTPGQDRLLDLLQFGELHEKEIANLWPLRAPGTPEPEGYDLRALLASDQNQNLARILTGSEGTLALITKLELKLVRRPAHRALGVCRFDSLSAALRSVPKIILLDPSAIELLDRTLLEALALQAPQESQAARLLQGDPEALLIVEFDRDNPVENTRALKALDGYAAEGGKNTFGVIEIVGEKAQASLWQLRRQALHRIWTMKSSAKPLPFMEDAAVPFHRLEEFAAGLEALLRKYGVRSAIYGHVGSGCLSVRPILNLRRIEDRARMRGLADEISALVAACGGVLSAGHGLGLSRSEALEKKLGPAAMKLFAELKSHLDPGYLLNPGRILRAPRFDDAQMLRVAHEIERENSIALTWGAAAAPEKALDHARQCNGLALCRTAELPFACPSYEVTGDERDSPRGRANTMRLALSGQLGEGALASDSMLDALRLCVSCKACRSACPFGIDIPKMKVEALGAARNRGRSCRGEELYARLPDYADRARRWSPLIHLRDLVPGLGRLTEERLGVAADRPLPRWSGWRFRAPRKSEPGPNGLVAIFADTFNRAFEPANLRAAVSVLKAAGYGVIAFADDGAGRGLCCGRTFYDAGHIEHANREAARLTQAAAEFRDRGVPVIGLEPACVLMMRDEYAALGLPVRPDPPVLLFEEFVARRRAEGKFKLSLKSIEARAVIHSHCHERAMKIEDLAVETLRLVPELDVSAAPPTCCGLNGFAGMTPDTFEASLAMAERALFPAIRKAGRDAFVAATGFSCRKQVQDGLGRAARHPAMMLELALKGDSEIVN
jgi:FAD/FMN-containing dehydrogenase/Fe-S oxidoreductase